MASAGMGGVGVLPSASPSCLGFTHPSGRHGSSCRSAQSNLGASCPPKCILGLGLQRTATAGMPKHDSFLSKRRTSASTDGHIASLLGLRLPSLETRPLRRKGRHKACIAAAQSSIVQPAIAVAGSVLGRIPAVILIPSCVAAIVYALTGFEGFVRLIRNRVKKLLNQPEEVPGEDNWASSRVRKYVVPYIRPVIIWAAMFVLCGSLDRLPTPLILSKVKAKTVNVVRVFASVFSVTYCITVLIQQMQAVVYQPVGPTEQVGKELVVQTVEAGIWFLGFALGMELLGVASNSFITAGGIGTLVFTFAGKEIVGNALSGMTIQATKPFTVGDWISIMVNGQFVEGHVEAMGWWQLTLKTFERESSRIANQQVINSVITNVTAKTHWRFKSYIHLYLFTPEEQVQKIVMDIRKLLAEHQKIEHRTLHRRVFYDGHNISVPSKDVLVSCYFQTRWQEEYSKLKEELMYEIERIISLHGSRYATPIRTHDYTAGRTPPTMSHSPYDSPTQRLFLAEMTVYKNPSDSSKMGVVDVIPSTPTTVDVTDTAVVNPVGGEGHPSGGRAESDVAAPKVRADVSASGADVSGSDADVSGSNAGVDGKVAGSGAEVGGVGDVAKIRADVRVRARENGADVSEREKQNGADVSRAGAQNAADDRAESSADFSWDNVQNGAHVSKRGGADMAGGVAKEVGGKETMSGQISGTEPRGNGTAVRTGNVTVTKTGKGGVNESGEGEKTGVKGPLHSQQPPSVDDDETGRTRGAENGTRTATESDGRQVGSDGQRGDARHSGSDGQRREERHGVQGNGMNEERHVGSASPRDDTLERELAEVLRRPSSPTRLRRALNRSERDRIPFSDDHHRSRDSPNEPGLTNLTANVTPSFTLQYRTPEEAAAAASAFSAAAAEAAAAAQALLSGLQNPGEHSAGQNNPLARGRSSSSPSGGHSVGQNAPPRPSTSYASPSGGHSASQIDPPPASTSYSSPSGGQSRRPSVTPQNDDSVRRGIKSGPVKPTGPQTSDRSEASDSPRGAFEPPRENESMGDVPYRGIKEGSSPGREWAKQYFAGDRPSARGFASVSEFEHLYDSDGEEDLRASEDDVADDLAPMSEEESASWRQADSAAAATRSNERLHDGGRLETRGPVGGRSDASSGQQRSRMDGTGPLKEKLEGLETMGLSRSDITLLGIAIDKTGRQSAVLDSAFDPSITPTQLAQRSGGAPKATGGSLPENGGGKESGGREDRGPESGEKEPAAVLVGKDGAVPASGNGIPPVSEQMV